jgi:molybdopterin adenylyltransferase
LKTFGFAMLTVSDRSSRGEREDLSAPAIRGLLEPVGGRLLHYEVVPDEIPAIQARLSEWADEKGVDLIVTTGGTGLHPRDVTPEATLPLLHKEIPGIVEAMRAAGLPKTPHAMLSRGLAGIRGSTLIVNLPGSPKGVKENLEVLLPALPHALEKIKGDPSECA